MGNLTPNPAVQRIKRRLDSKSVNSWLKIDVKEEPLVIVKRYKKLNISKRAPN
jgi:hypothetical protein